MRGAGLWAAREREFMITTPGRYYLWHNGDVNPLPMGAGNLALALRFVDGQFRSGNCSKEKGCRFWIRIAPPDVT